MGTDCSVQGQGCGAQGSARAVGAWEAGDLKVMGELSGPSREL